MDASDPLLRHIILILGFLGLLLALRFLVRKRRREKITVASEAPELPSSPAAPAPSGWWNALAKTRARFWGGGEHIEALKENLEEACLATDLGVKNTQELLKQVDWQRVGAQPEGERVRATKAELAQKLRPWLPAAPDAHWPQAAAPGEGPRVIWFVGVNGVGKTTSIAKLAQELLKRGHKVLLGAGDTFRAAASEQLEMWGQRLGIDCIKGPPGGDASAVLFDAIQAGKARGMDFVLCDSAGRLHTQSQLMEALSKNRRVMEKALPGAPHEVLLVLDANTGQNMITQAEQFLKAVQVTGLVLTKLDGTARGGAVVAVARHTGLPLRRLGLGEKAEDFVPFDPESFSQALLGLED